MIIINDGKFEIRTGETDTLVIHKDVIIKELEGKLLPEDVEASLSCIEASNLISSLMFDIMAGTKCSKCNLKDKCAASGRISRCVPYGNISPEIMFINKMPSELEHASTHTHSDTLGVFLTLILSKLGYKREQLYFTDMIKCNAPSIDDDSLWCCITSYLLKEIQLIAPKIVVCEGLPILKLLKESGNFESLPDIDQLAYGTIYDATFINGNQVKLVAIYSLDKVLEKVGDDYEACKNKLWQQLVNIKQCIK